MKSFGTIINWKKWGVVISAIGLLLVVCGLFTKYHEQFADAKEMYKINSKVMQVDARLIYFTLTNQAAEIQKRLWQLEDRYKCEEHEMPQTAKEEHRRLRMEREKLLDEAEKYKGKK